VLRHRVLSAEEDSRVPDAAGSFAYAVRHLALAVFGALAALPGASVSVRSCPPAAVGRPYGKR
jgi:ABC-type uncharacterized transport system permease subunit